MKKLLFIVFAITFLANTFTNTFGIVSQECARDMLLMLIENQAKFEIEARRSVTKEINNIDDYRRARIIVKYGLDILAKELSECVDWDAYFKNQLLKNSDLNYPLLHLAARHNQVEILNKILDAGENIDYGITTSCHHKFLGGCNVLTDMQPLLSSSIGNIEIPAHTNIGTTALTFAVLEQAQEAVELLLSKKANTNISNHVGTPLLIAIASYPYPSSDDSQEKEKATNIIKLLLQHGADPNLGSDKKNTLGWLSALKRLNGPCIKRPDLFPEEKVDALIDLLNQNCITC